MNGDDDSAKRSNQARGGVGLLIIDMVNDMAFPGAEPLRHGALEAAHALRGLRDEADRLGVPTVYVNDNYGEWRSERSAIIAHCRAANAHSARLIETIGPRRDDYFVIKPQFSGFYATNLPALLPRLGVNRLVIAGVATDVCVLFTAASAHMREYDLRIPSDATASDDPQRKDWALGSMRNSMKARTDATGAMALETWIDGPGAF